MEALLQWGVDLIIVIQQIHGPILDSTFSAITFLGDEEFYLLLLPLMLWCMDFAFSARIAVLFLLSACDKKHSSNASPECSVFRGAGSGRSLAFLCSLVGVSLVVSGRVRGDWEDHFQDCFRKGTETYRTR